MIAGAGAILVIVLVLVAFLVWVGSPRGWLPGASLTDAASETLARLFPRRTLTRDRLRARLWRVTRAQVSADVGGRPLVPSTIHIALSASDFDLLGGVIEWVSRDLEARLVATAKDQDWHVVATPKVIIRMDPDRPVGRPLARGSFVEGTRPEAPELPTASLVEASLEGLGHAPSFVLTGDRPLTLGRDRVCDLCVSGDTAVSRRHAELVPDAGAWFVHDLGSLNGVLVNERRIQRTRLADGDRVRVTASTVFTYRAGASDTAGPR